MKKVKCEVCGEMIPQNEMSKSYRHRCKKCVADITRAQRHAAKQMRKAQENVPHTYDPATPYGNPVSEDGATNAAQSAWKRFIAIDIPIGVLFPAIHPLFAEGYKIGASEATTMQWKDPNVELPVDDRQVLVETDCRDNELRHAISYFLAGAWHFPDDWYYDCRVLRWMYIPSEKGGEQ